ncbi:alpha/beta fold hydrolase [Occultella gossypii]|uniref:Alpha/beta hydrolase n=1 Tax=Occultella gossypii TaxID=2800820 RepID=A0ABS7S3Q3_9MICO|nr:alpha/beta hydrolase [Occultella gossypii]MBZ2194972.1 alpha/beta hydrolase [Occultella gossypii]
MTAIEHASTHLLELPGGSMIAYDVRGEAGPAPTLLAIGFPMDATGFGTLVAHFDDRRTVTYDPRGVGRSVRAESDTALLTPDDHADDLARLVDALGGGPVDVVASSGGAVNALAFVARYPDLARVVVAHEPPLTELLPDRDVANATCEQIHRIYTAGGLGPAMAKFIALVGHDGELPAGFPEEPAPDPAAFGLPTEDDGSRDDPMLGGSILTAPSYAPDYETIRRSSTRVIVAVGEESGATLAARGARATGDRLGAPAAVFPGDHTGFLGNEYGRPGRPDEFAAKLREVLAAR